MVELLQRVMTPKNRTIVALGDSFMALEEQVSSGKSFLSAKGAVNWAVALSGARYKFGRDLIKGVSGNKTNQILARVQDAIDTGAGICFLNGDINDLNDQRDLGLIVEDKIATIQALTDAGMVVVAEPVLPRFTLKAEYTFLREDGGKANRVYNDNFAFQAVADF